MSQSLPIMGTANSTVSFEPVDGRAVGGPEHGDAGTEPEQRINCRVRLPEEHSAIRREDQAGLPSPRGSQGRDAGEGS